MAAPSPTSGILPTITATHLDLHLHPYLCRSFPKPTLVLILDNAFTPTECAEFTSVALASADPTLPNPWLPAEINVGGKQIVDRQERDCGRIILDDQGVADKILQRIRPYLVGVEVLGGGKWDGVAGGQEGVWKISRHVT